MDIIFPITTGLVVVALKSGLAGSAFAIGLTVQPELPDAKTRRMVTVRNDGGPDDGVQSRRRYGFNVWADSSDDAENLALLCMAILRTLPDGKPVTLVDQLSGPYSIADDPPYKLAGKSLHHFFFTARFSVRGTNY